MGNAHQGLKRRAIQTALVMGCVLGTVMSTLVLGGFVDREGPVSARHLKSGLNTLEKKRDEIHRLRRKLLILSADIVEWQGEVHAQPLEISGWIPWAGKEISRARIQHKTTLIRKIMARLTLLQEGYKKALESMVDLDHTVWKLAVEQRVGLASLEVLSKFHQQLGVYQQAYQSLESFRFHFDESFKVLPKFAHVWTAFDGVLTALCAGALIFMFQALRKISPAKIFLRTPRRHLKVHRGGAHRPLKKAR